MNILFIGPYAQYDGWGIAAYHYLNALLTTQHNICANRIYTSTTHKLRELPDKILQVERNHLPYYDIVIQCMLPHYCASIDKVKTVVIMFGEAKSYKNTIWDYSLKGLPLDAIIVPSVYEKTALNLPNTHVIPIPHNTTQLTGAKYPLQIPQNGFVFYSIGEYIQRKNYLSLLIAFQREFKSHENVYLTIKTNNLNRLSQEFKLTKQMMAICKTSEYQNEHIIDGFLTDEELGSLHNRCDCFVTASSGEACCMPILDGFTYGNPAIVNRNSSMAEFIGGNGFLVNSHEAPIVTSDSYHMIYNANLTWYEIEILDLQRQMRAAFEMWKNNNVAWANKQDMARQTIKEFTYDKVGQQLNNLIEQLN